MTHKRIRFMTTDGITFKAVAIRQTEITDKEDQLFASGMQSLLEASGKSREALLEASQAIERFKELQLNPTK